MEQEVGLDDPCWSFSVRIFHDSKNKLHDKCERQTHASVCENRGFIFSTLRIGTTLYLYSMISFHDGIHDEDSQDIYVYFN